MVVPFVSRNGRPFGAMVHFDNWEWMYAAPSCTFYIRWHTRTLFVIFCRITGTLVGSSPFGSPAPLHLSFVRGGMPSQQQGERDITHCWNQQEILCGLEMFAGCRAELAVCYIVCCKLVSHQVTSLHTSLQETTLT